MAWANRIGILSSAVEEPIRVEETQHVPQCKGIVHHRALAPRTDGATKSGRGVGEHYVRDDIPCYSLKCKECQLLVNADTRQPFPSQPLPFLSAESDVYLIPTAAALARWMPEALQEVQKLCECADEPIQDVIILQTVLTEVSKQDGRAFREIKKRLLDDSLRWTLFSNEHHQDTSALTSVSSDTNLHVQAVAEWYHTHLNAAVKLIILTDQHEEGMQLLLENQPTTDITMQPLGTYLESLLSNRLQLSAKNQLGEDEGSWLHDEIEYWAEAPLDTTRVQYEPHVDYNDALAGVQQGKYMLGVLHKTNRREESMLELSNWQAVTEQQAVYIYGKVHHNRAFSGDTVAVQLVGSRTRETQLDPHEGPADDDNEDDDDHQLLLDKDQKGKEEQEQQIVATAKVVCVLQQGRMEFVVTVRSDSNTVDDKDDKEQAEDAKRSAGAHRFEHVICVPFDSSLPLCRVGTHDKNSLKDKRILVKRSGWDLASQLPAATVIRVIGCIGDVTSESESILADKGLVPKDWSIRALNEVRFSLNLPTIPTQLLTTKEGTRLPWDIPQEEYDKRLDYRSVFTFSMDPIGCMDIDDAVSVRSVTTGGGSYVEVGVHITDVAYFVPPQSALDQEARMRGTSVYLVSSRIDMLPTLLSTNICSLKEKQDRLAISVLLKFSTDNLQYMATDIQLSMVNVDYNLSYTQAQHIFERKFKHNRSASHSGGNGVQYNTTLSKPELNRLYNDLNTLKAITDNLREKRGSAEAMDLDQDGGGRKEAKFKLDSRGQPEKMQILESTETSMILSELMIQANIRVGKFLYDKNKMNTVFRRHLPPKKDKIEFLRMKVQSFGLNIDNILQEYNELHRLKNIFDNIDNSRVKTYLLKLLDIVSESAEYHCCDRENPKLQTLPNFRHIGLGSIAYVHFTSPIHRYADLATHRSVREVLQTQNPKWCSYEYISQLVNHLNKLHQAAQQAHNQNSNWYRAWYFRVIEQQQEEEEEEGVAPDKLSALVVNGEVTRITPLNFHVHLPRYGMSGVVKLKNWTGGIIPEDWCLKHEGSRTQLISRRSTLSCSIQYSFDEAVTDFALYKMSHKKHTQDEEAAEQGATENQPSYDLLEQHTVKLSDWIVVRIHAEQSRYRPPMLQLKIVSLCGRPETFAEDGVTEFRNKSKQAPKNMNKETEKEGTVDEHASTGNQTKGDEDRKQQKADSDPTSPVSSVAVPQRPKKLYCKGMIVL